MKMQELSPLDMPLTGKTLVEASAGTGKTWTIAALYVRLIVEVGLTVDQILVVTFTKASTAELRQRLRDRLTETLRVIEGGETADKFLLGLRGKVEDVKLIERRLLLALRSFDESAIFTIHGFCQRLLGDAALESNMPFEQELQTDDTDLLQLAVDDFWRRALSDATPEVLALIRYRKLAPETLARDLKPALGKPYLAIAGTEQTTDYEALYMDAASKYQRARSIWAASAPEIQDVLIGRVGLKKTQYQAKRSEGWFGKLEGYLENPEPGPLPKDRDGYEKWVTRLGSRDLEEYADGEGVFPGHEFFDTWQEYIDACYEFEAALEPMYFDLCRRLLEYLNTAVYNEKQAAGVMTHDDLLLRTDEALRGSSGEHLAALTCARYPAAMIDEFQDTDPVQYNIFSCIYASDDQTAIFVGDPKQAIYGFRGADVFTYLSAREHIGQRYTLSKNFRSTEGVLSAVNALFDRHARPFWLENIPYKPVSAGKPELSEERVAREMPPFRLLRVGEEGDNKADLSQQIANVVANDIANILNRADDERWTMGDREFNAGDIAVLVRSHTQASLMRAALNQRGISCVQRSRENVFQSEEAAEIRILLTGIAAATDEGRIKSALATRLLGQNATEIAALQGDMGAWENWLARFASWRSLWQSGGFMRMFRQWMHDQRVYARLLALADGERRLTNILHLAELLHVEATQQGLGMDGLIGWLGRACQETSENEERLIRLESDEHLVQIMTVHNSKGLQFGVVYCPFLWAENKADIHGPFVFHDPDHNWRSSLEMGSPERERWAAQKQEEEFADSLRLLYVAVTRARFHCSVVMTPDTANQGSALAWLLYGRDLRPTNLEQMRVMLSEQAGQGFSPELASEMSLETADPESGVVRLRKLHESTLGRPRQFRAKIARPEVVTSYTALTAGVTDEKPDYDFSVKATQLDSEIRFRGAQAGSCLHQMLELLDFSKPVNEQMETVVKPALEEYGFSESLLDFSTVWLQRVLNTSLKSGEGFSLSNLASTDRLNEMEFWFPVEALDAEALQNLLREYLPEHFYTAIGQLSFDRITGYLKGYIDLIYRYQGRYYVVDYKSNWLGGVLEDYSPERLTEAIAEEQYYLQYLLYTVAVHRMLRLRLPDYDYERHFGEVQYLFLRGMDPENEGVTGIYHDRPPVGLVNVLERWLGSNI